MACAGAKPAYESPGGQEFHFPHFSSNFRQFFLLSSNILHFFPQFGSMGGWSSIKEGPGYNAGRVQLLLA